MFIYTYGIDCLLEVMIKHIDDQGLFSGNVYSSCVQHIVFKKRKSQMKKNRVKIHMCDIEMMFTKCHLNLEYHWLSFSASRF